MSLSTPPRSAARAAEISDRLNQMANDLLVLAREANNIGALSDTDMRHEDIATMRHITGTLTLLQRAVSQEAHRWSQNASGRKALENNVLIRPPRTR